MSVELTVITSLGCALLGAILGFFTFFKNSKKDAANDAKTEAVLASELGYIKAGVDDIKRKQERMDDKYEAQHLEVITRLTLVEASSTQAHVRLDKIEGKI